MTTRKALVIELTGLNPTWEECPELFNYDNRLNHPGIQEVKPYVIRRWPKAKIENLVLRVRLAREVYGWPTSSD